MIYLDNAATSLIKPVEVERAVISAMRSMASPGRGGHAASMKASELLYQCREYAAEFFNVKDPSNVVFSFNASHALNMAINSLAERGSRVLVSGYEHNSVIRPLMARDAQISTAGTTLFDPGKALEEFERLIPGADLVVCSHVSNVFGFILPVYEIGRLCRRAGVPYIVDASQSAGVLEIDMERMGADFVAMPGHKGLMGPQGTGLLLCAGKARPLIEGGSGSDSLSPRMPGYLPDMLEAGTHNVCGIAGLLAGMKYIRSKGTEEIYKHERKLIELMANVLDDKKLSLYISQSSKQSGVLSFVAQGIDCEELAREMDEMGVCSRAGLHCAPLAHKSAHTLETGTVRLSFSPFTTEAQVISAASVIKEIIKNK